MKSCLKKAFCILKIAYYMSARSTTTSYLKLYGYGYGGHEQ